MAIRKIVTRSVEDSTILAVDLNPTAFGNTSMPMPAGTTAERVANPGSNGHFRLNTTTNQVELYKANSWGAFVDVGYHTLTIAESGYLVHERYSSSDGNVTVTDSANAHSAFFTQSGTTFNVDSNGNLIVNF